MDFIWEGEDLFASGVVNFFKGGKLGPMLELPSDMHCLGN
jgi:hypothetical protein